MPMIAAVQEGGLVKSLGMGLMNKQRPTMKRQGSFIHRIPRTLVHSAQQET